MSAYQRIRCASCWTELRDDMKSCTKCQGTKHEKTWHYRKRISLPDGTRDRITGTPATNTKAAAESAERDHIDRKVHPERYLTPMEPTSTTPKGTVPTVREFVSRFVAECTDGKSGALRVRTLHLRGTIAKFVGHLRLDEIDQSHVNAIKSALKGKASQTIRNKLYALSALLRYASQLKIIPPHTLDLAVKGTTAPTKIEATPTDHVRKLLKVAKDPRWTVALLLASEDGLRIGEIRGAQWTDVKDGSITIRRAIDDRNEIGSPKWGRVRTVPLSSATIAALRKLPKRGVWLVTRLDDSDKARKGQKRVSAPGGFVGYSGMVKVIARLYRNAKLGEPADDINPWHSLRHAYGTKLAGANVPLSVIQQLMGHADIRTTMRYVSTSEAQKAQAVARVFR